MLYNIYSCQVPGYFERLSFISPVKFKKGLGFDDKWIEETFRIRDDISRYL